MVSREKRTHLAESEYIFHVQVVGHDVDEDVVGDDIKTRFIALSRRVEEQRDRWRQVSEVRHVHLEPHRA